MTQTYQSRRIVIIGPGATGGAIAAELHDVGVEVLLVARGDEYEAINRHGLRYHTTDGVRELRIPVVDGPAGAELRPTDILLIATKAQDVEPALRAWAWQPVSHPDGSTTPAARTLPLLTIQNGLNTERVALRWFATVYAAAIGCPAGKEGPGEVLNFGAAARVLCWLGRYHGGSDAQRREIATLLRQAAPIRVQEVQDVVAWKAWKLGYNTVNALEPVFTASALRDELRQRLRREALDVFAAMGIRPVDPYHDSSSELDFALIAPQPVPGRTRAGNSTLQSFLRGATLESDYLNGEVVLLGRLHGVPTPLNAALQELVQQAAAESRAPGALGDDAIRELLDGAPVGQESA
ncbi:ketopantoate reductase family protein [Micromonospora zingiberis]|nr:ketopantoate reductase family protein [Micromonospora zingiberis]